MKKLLLIFVLLIAFQGRVHACDVCGCKLGGLYMGILPQFSSHYIGIRYSYASFHASIRYNSEYLEDETSDDIYNRMELTGRYTFSEKVQVFGILPYSWNHMDGTHQVARVSGIGDPMILGYYTLLDNSADLTATKRHYLLAGGGIKLPFGDDSAEDNGAIINRNFQLGTGSVDFILSANYTYRAGVFGLNAESSYKINTENGDGYRFGNEANVSLNAFYSWQKPQYSLLPFAGMVYESARPHSENQVTVLNTGGTSLFGTAGAQFYKNSWIFTLQAQLPIAQSFNTDEYSEITAHARFTAGVIFNLPLSGKAMGVNSGGE